MQLDRLDARLLAELQSDGRRSVVEISEAIGLSQTPSARRIRQLEQSGVIQGYTAVVDPVKLGLKVSAFIQVKLERHVDENVEMFRHALEALDQVMSCHATSGAYDFMLQAVATDLESLSDLVLKRLLAIPCVRDVHSHIVLQTFKRSVRLPLDHLSESSS